MRILVCNSAHIGDVILTTAVLPVLKSAYPQVEIGVCIGSWSLPVVENHTLIDHIHIFDHPLHNRSSKSIASKKRQGSKTWLQAHKEIVEKKYDIAFDFYSLYEKNAARLLYHANVPERVGWFGFNPIHYNCRFFWIDFINDKDLHTVEIHGQLLREYGIEEAHLEKLKPTLTYRNAIPNVSLPENYFVVHMGVGEKKREWNQKSWKDLVLLLDSLGHPIVFVGHGNKEKELIAEAVKDLKTAVNLCNSLSWKQLIPLIKGAKLLVGLESMAGHIAAATHTPAVLIYGGTAKVARWRPFNQCCEVATPATHFFDEKGRAPMHAIHAITAQDVFQKVKLALSR